MMVASFLPWIMAWVTLFLVSKRHNEVDFKALAIVCLAAVKIFSASFDYVLVRSKGQ